MRGRRFTQDGGLTFSKFFQEVPEAPFALSFVSTPAVETPVLLPLTTEVGPACTRGGDLFSQKTFELFFWILLFLLDLRLAEFTSTITTVFVKGFTSRRN